MYHQLVFPSFLKQQIFSLSHYISHVCSCRICFFNLEEINQKKTVDIEFVLRYGVGLWESFLGVLTRHRKIYVEGGETISKYTFTPFSYFLLFFSLYLIPISFLMRKYLQPALICTSDNRIELEQGMGKIFCFLKSFFPISSETQMVERLKQRVVWLFIKDWDWGLKEQLLQAT